MHHRYERRAARVTATIDREVASARLTPSTIMPFIALEAQRTLKGSANQKS
jgi:hypothetical protein